MREIEEREVGPAPTAATPCSLPSCAAQCSSQSWALPNELRSYPASYGPCTRHAAQCSSQSCALHQMCYAVLQAVMSPAPEFLCSAYAVLSQSWALHQMSFAVPSCSWGLHQTCCAVLQSVMGTALHGLQPLLTDFVALQKKERAEAASRPAPSGGSFVPPSRRGAAADAARNRDEVPSSCHCSL